jgi:hypothetical protein
MKLALLLCLYAVYASSCGPELEPEQREPLLRRTIACNGTPQQLPDAGVTSLALRR